MGYNRGLGSEHIWDRDRFMRQIGRLPDESAAQRFAAYLLTHDISATPEQDAEDWIIWVHDENTVTRSREALENFRRDPDAEIYQQAQRAAEEILRKAREAEKQTRKNVRDLGGQWNRSGSQRRPLTLSVVILCVAIFFVSTESRPIFESLLFCSGVEYEETRNPQASILQGQVWRLFTPILLHGSPIHLLFNMYWLWQLGGIIESRRGRLTLAWVGLLTALLSNLVQANMPDASQLPTLLVPFHGGPDFVGSSGVVYGLLGYIWVTTRLDPTSGMFLHPNTVMFMIAWAFLCLTPLFPGVANSAHFAGLLAGMGGAYLALSRRKTS